jgi:hypothetical protein
VLATLALTPGVAQAQYPYDWHAATPPSWFTESVDSSCHIREEFTSQSEGTYRSWVLFYDSYESDPNFVCIKPLPATPELGPGYSLKCAGLVRHVQYDGHPDLYGAIWECYVTGDDAGSAACQRTSWYGESPLGDPNEAYNMDSGGWIDPETFEPDDCRPSGSQEDDPDEDDTACKKAKKKLEQAKRRLERADSPREKKEARKKLKKARNRKADACG